MSEVRADGVYFGLDENEYHADDALGSTDIKNLLIGPEIYWASTPMNPLFERKETKSTVRGSAYHKLILEGEEAFRSAYCEEPDKADFPNALYTTEDLKEALKRLDLPTSGKKQLLIDRLIEADPAAQVWDVIWESFLDENDGRQPIPKKMFAEIFYASRFIFANPYLRDAFQGGHPEVSIFYTRDGVRRKARIDYLKPAVSVDLKSYSNPFGSRADVAVHQAFIRNGYDIQAAWYRPALMAAKGLPFFGDKPDASWESAFRRAPEAQQYFVFQATDGIPMARAKWANYALQTIKIAEMNCENAVELYKQCLAEFGSDPWIIPEKPSTFEDEGMPMFRR